MLSCPVFYKNQPGRDGRISREKPADCKELARARQTHGRSQHAPHLLPRPQFQGCSRWPV